MQRVSDAARIEVDRVASEAKRLAVSVVTGRFGAKMEMSLVNSVPVIVLVETGHRL